MRVATLGSGYMHGTGSEVSRDDGATQQHVVLRVGTGEGIRYDSADIALQSPQKIPHGPEIFAVITVRAAV